MALEVNNSSLLKPAQRLHCYENYRTMLALCQEQGVPIAVSSDAHDPSQVGEFRLARQLLEELILNTDLARLKAFLSLPARWE